MARVKRGVTSHAKHKKTRKPRKALRAAKNTIRAARRRGPRQSICLSRRKRKKRTFRALWIRGSMREPRARLDLRPIYQRPRQGRGRGRSQGDADIAVREPAASSFWSTRPAPRSPEPPSLRGRVRGRACAPRRLRSGIDGREIRDVRLKDWKPIAAAVAAAKDDVRSRLCGSQPSARRVRYRSS